MLLPQKTESNNMVQFLISLLSLAIIGTIVYFGYELFKKWAGNKLREAKEQDKRRSQDPTEIK